MRTYDYARPRRGERQLHAVLEFAAGRLLLQPAVRGRLYRLSLDYDADRFRPIGRYDREAGEVRLGVEGIRRRRHTGRSPAGAAPAGRDRAVPERVDLTLDVSMGAAESTLDLGGLRLSSLELKSGRQPNHRDRFDRPATGSCRTASVTLGRGRAHDHRRGNSGCRCWRFDGGVGEVTLDLGGAWPADARMAMNMALGGVTLQAPKDLGHPGADVGVPGRIRREGIQQGRQDLHVGQLRFRETTHRGRCELGAGGCVRRLEVMTSLSDTHRVLRRVGLTP